MSIFRSYKSVNVISVYLFFSILIFLIGGISWSYSTFYNIFENEIVSSLDRIFYTSELIFDQKKIDLNNDIDAMLRNKAAINYLRKIKKDPGKNLVRKDYFDCHCDFVLIKFNKNNFIIDLSNAFPDITGIKNQIVEKQRDYLLKAKLIKFNVPQYEYAIILRSKKIVSKSGNVVGVIIAGAVVDYNQLLANEIRKKTNTDIIAIYYDSKLLITSGEIRDREFVRAHVSSEMHPKSFILHEEDDNYHILARRKIRTLGADSKLNIAVTVQNNRIYELQEKIKTQSIISIFAAILFFIVSYLFFNKSILNAIIRLVNHAGEISKGNYKNIFKRGKIEEVNLVGQAIDMVVNKMHVALLDSNESENKFRSFSEQTFLGIMVFENDELFYINGAAENILAVNKEKLLGLRLENFIENYVVRDTTEFSDKFKSDIKIGNNTTLFMKSWDLVNHAGQLKHLEVFIKKIELKGKLADLIYMQDVTIRKKAEVELYKSREYLKTILNSIGEAVIVTDENFKIKSLNPEAEKLFGVPSIDAFELFLTDIASFYNYVNKEKIADIAKVIIDKENSFNIDDSLIVKGLRGDSRIVTVSCDPMHAVEQQVIGYVLVFHDITELKKTQEAIVQNEKMLSVGGLAAGMAHEINNPLAGILQNLQVVKKRLTEDAPGNIKAAQELGVDMNMLRDYLVKRKVSVMLDDIQESGIRASKIVKNMLSFVSDEYSEALKYSMDDLLDKALELAQNDYDLSSRFDFKKVKIIKEYQPGTPQIKCNPSKIQQVFLSIIINSAEAMFQKKGKKYQPQLYLKIFEDDKKVVIEIEDNGPGINDDVRKRIFEPFYTTKVVGKGPGLGLSIAYFIITEYHKGTMSVESEPGEWTKFIIMLSANDN